MNFFGKTILVFTISLSLLFTGCASYNASSLSALDPQFVKEPEEIEGFSIGCKAFTGADCQTYLDRDVIRRGYLPIQLTFNNQTDKFYLFSTQGINLRCVNPEVVADMVHTSTIGRVTGYTIGAIFFTPLIIPAIVDGIKSSKANKLLDVDFREKAQETFVIAPKSYNKTLFFVPKKDFKPYFDLTLVEQETGIEKTVKLFISQ